MRKALTEGRCGVPRSATEAGGSAWFKEDVTGKGLAADKAAYDSSSSATYADMQIEAVEATIQHQFVNWLRNGYTGRNESVLLK